MKYFRILLYITYC